MKRILGPAAATALLGIAGIAACGADSLAAPASAQGTPVRYVDMKDRGSDAYAYRPQTLRVRAGTRVVWRNRSSAPHSVTATGKQQAFDQTVGKDIEPRQRWAFVFRHPGRYRYYCVFHPYMKGTVVVTG